jgi:hypothetical protein
MQFESEIEMEMSNGVEQQLRLRQMAQCCKAVTTSAESKRSTMWRRLIPNLQSTMLIRSVA